MYTPVSLSPGSDVARQFAKRSSKSRASSEITYRFARTQTNHNTKVCVHALTSLPKDVRRSIIQCPSKDIHLLTTYDIINHAIHLSFNGQYLQHQQYKRQIIIKQKYYVQYFILFHTMHGAQAICLLVIFFYLNEFVMSFWQTNTDT